ncbi:MAG TPA: class I SAM-dependent methyltransferase, partial [Candidatus Pacearchaeota archaeon]|nr:class I SAM-dependent methyltransferase [Candidatus Pacearchaeota archaeon]
MISEKEKKVQDFFNKRIKVQGDDNFTPEIGSKNESGWMILNFLKSQIGKKGKILDAGCGVGRFARYFIENGFNLIGMDFSKEDVRLAKQKIGKGTFVVGSVTEIPFKDNSFDYI